MFFYACLRFILWKRAVPEDDSCIFYSILFWVLGALLWHTEPWCSFKFRKKRINYRKPPVTNKISMSGKKRDKVAAKKLKRSSTIQIVVWPESGTLGWDALWKGYYELELWNRNFSFFMPAFWGQFFPDFYFSYVIVSSYRFSVFYLL